MEELALKGGKPVRETVLHFVPLEADMTEEEINAVLEVYRSRKLSQLVSEKINEFEEAFAKYYGIEYAMAVNSGTASLHVALAAAGVGPANDVILPPYTFMATANAI
ncbi:MAG: DegT/DnrJ/EryC1/StrS family aminotransferase, partial [Candidatus Bathyarchaeota archaeon]|nr:DegT/DnrJ/EryC1/StrS family aminotransferase [Candidatus Bathyarchaeota archaeon]